MTQPNTQLDRWGIQANRFMLAHILRTLSAHPQDARILGNEPALVLAKNRWAADMRDMATDQGVDPGVQKAVWLDYLAAAHAQR